MNKLFFLVFLLHMSSFISAQTTDTTLTSQDAIYNRPFIQIPKIKSSIGGYVEGNTNYFIEDGVTDGFSMELRRFNFFLYSNIHDKIKFISEIEFEHGTEEISLETALVDFEFNPSLNLRAGILLPNIGMVNANHDSPKWEFIERPLSSTDIIPSTLSEVGFGIHGKFFPGNYILSYDTYLTNGLQDGVILNNAGKTNLASGKNTEMFAEDNNGMPMYNAKISLSNRKLGEIGVSYYGGIYNTFTMDGNIIDSKKALALYAFDFTTQIKKLKFIGELAFVNINVPENINTIYSEKQYAAFLELSYPIMNRRMLGFNNALLNISTRAERIDYNLASFSDGSKIRDDVNAISLGIGWRPIESTIIRFNYRHNTIHDFLGNPPMLKAGFQVGVASYF